MWFDGKRVSEITPDEIEDLVKTGAHEDATLEFKRELNWGKDQQGEELLHDLASFANADGGYIIAGVAEKNHRAAHLHHVPDAVKEAGRLRDLCLQHIQPRIRDLEISPVTIPAHALDVIMVRIPESGSRPHMVTCNDGTHFCRRYQDRKRTMSIEEVREAFEERARIRHPGAPNLDAKLDEYLALERRKRLEALAASDSTRDAMSPEEVAKIMDLRFRQRIGDNPYFRMFCLPEQMQPLDLSERRPRVEELLSEPPRTRRDGWVIGPWPGVKRTHEGWVDAGLGETITLLDSGYLEYSQPCDDDSFQWGRLSSRSPTPELFPFAVCELPVNFALLAKDLYGLTGLAGALLFHMEYVNITGFVLRPGVPNSMIYMMPSGLVDVKGYDQSEIAVECEPVNPDFEPGPLAFSLVEQVYSAFGYPRKYIPCFDKDRHFDVDVNSFQE